MGCEGCRWTYRVLDLTASEMRVYSLGRSEGLRREEIDSALDIFSSRRNMARTGGGFKILGSRHMQKLC